MRTRTILFASLVSFLPFAAMAQTTTSYPSSGSTDFLGLPDGELSAGVKIGTLGIGGEVGYRPYTMFGARLDGEAFSFSDDITAGRATYHATAELQSYGALADLYPFGESFRITGGLRLNENEIRGDATSVQARVGGITETLPTSDFGNLGGKVTFDKLSPYLGFGWGGDIAPGLALTTDFGVMFNGNPKASVAGSLNATSAGTPTLLTSAVNAGLQQGLANARSDLQHEVDGYEYFPVIEIGLTYRF